MLTASFYTLASLLAIAAAEESNEGRPDIVYGSPLNSVDNTTLRYMKEGLANPNATRSIGFTPFEGQGLGLGDTTWTWRVNVSDFILPEGHSTPAGDDGRNVVATAYDLSWPGGGNITTELFGANASRPVCITGVVRKSFAPNVTNAFTADDADSTSCEPALGRACVDAILRQEVALGDRCARDDNRHWFRIPECYSSFGYSQREYDAAFQLKGLNLTDRDGVEYASGDRFMTSVIWPFDAESEDGDVYSTAARHLQVLMIQTTTEGGSRASQLLCTRVDTDEFEGAASSVHKTLGSMWFMTFAVGLLFTMA